MGLLISGRKIDTFGEHQKKDLLTRSSIGGAPGFGPGGRGFEALRVIQTVKQNPD